MEVPSVITPLLLLICLSKDSICVVLNEKGSAALGKGNVWRFLPSETFKNHLNVPKENALTNKSTSEYFNNGIQNFFLVTNSSIRSFDKTIMSRQLKAKLIKPQIRQDSLGQLQPRNYKSVIAKTFTSKSNTETTKRKIFKPTTISVFLAEPSGLPASKSNKSIALKEPSKSLKLVSLTSSHAPQNTTSSRATFLTWKPIKRRLIRRSAVRSNYDTTVKVKYTTSKPYITTNTSTEHRLTSTKRCKTKYTFSTTTTTKYTSTTPKPATPSLCTKKPKPSPCYHRKKKPCKKSTCSPIVYTTPKTVPSTCKLKQTATTKRPCGVNLNTYSRKNNSTSTALVPSRFWQYLRNQTNNNYNGPYVEGPLYYDSHLSSRSDLNLPTNFPWFVIRS